MVDVVLDTEGRAAPPRRNGELAFEAPWESQLFGLTLALHGAGIFVWEEFRRRLIGAVADAERRDAWRYWVCWLTALEALLADKGVCAPGEVDARVRTLAARPRGHDH